MALEDLDVDLVPDVVLAVEVVGCSFDSDYLEDCSSCALNFDEEEVVEAVLDFNGLGEDNFDDVEADLSWESDLDFDSLENDSLDDLKDDVG